MKQEVALEIPVHALDIPSDKGRRSSSIAQYCPVKRPALMVFSGNEMIYPQSQCNGQGLDDRFLTPPIQKPAIYTTAF